MSVAESPSARVSRERRFTLPLPQHLVDECEALGRVRRIPANMILAQEGDTIETFCVVKQGRLRVMMSAPDGRNIIVGHMRDGEYFGEAMIDGGTRVATVTSCGQAELISLSRRQFIDLMAERPDFTKHVLAKMAGMLRATMHFAKRLALLEVEDRVKLLLADLAEEYDGQMVLRPCLSQQAIADRVGASRSMINRVMKRLEAEGFLVRQGQEFVIKL